MISYTIPLLLSYYYSQSGEHWEEVAVKNGTVEIAIALVAYRMKNSAYPEELEQLTPAFLGKIPNDPFSDGPLRYKRLQWGCLVYSVGPNGKDECGEFDGSVWPEKDDVNTRIPVP
jgi:hypothetical protein